MADYICIRYPSESDLGLSNCYLCGKPLDSETTPDHIIPYHIFNKKSPSRPTLPVHSGCNNLKSKEDQWFAKYVQLHSAFDPRAEAEFSSMMVKAINEKSDAYVIGKNPRNYKLAKTIFDKTRWGFELIKKHQSFLQLKMPTGAVSRFERYCKTMCLGLFVRNIPLSRPAIPELIIRQYADLELKDLGDDYARSIKSFIDLSRDTKFGQMWGSKISYIGSRVVETKNKGFIFVQFYSQIGILAVFR